MSSAEQSLRSSDQSSPWNLQTVCSCGTIANVCYLEMLESEISTFPLDRGGVIIETEVKRLNCSLDKTTESLKRSACSQSALTG